MSALRSAAFRWLLASSQVSSFGTGMQLTATSWLALDAAGGAFTVGLVLAARMVPNLLFGLAAGTLADHADRGRLLVIGRLLALPVTLALAWLAATASGHALNLAGIGVVAGVGAGVGAAGTGAAGAGAASAGSAIAGAGSAVAGQGAGVNVAVLVTLSFLTGCLTVFDAPARQALVMDTVPRELAPNAMALHATAVRLFLALGAFAAGALIPAGGVASCFVATTAMFVAAAGVTLPIRAASPARVVRAPVPQANDGVPHDQQALRAGQNGRRVGPGQRVTFAEALRQAGRLVFDVADLRTLVLAAVACEIFGFSFQTAVPAFARDVLGAGAEGLGTLNGATSLGGALAVVGLSLVPGRLPREPLLGLVFVVFGASMLVLAPAGTLVAAAAVLLVTGACSASFDVLQQTLMQLAVPEDQRGRAVGVWVLGIGSAPIGNLEMGALVASLGAPMALAINGGLVLVAAATLLARAPGYRRILLRAPR